MAVMEGGEARSWYSGSHGGSANGLPTAASGGMTGANGQTNELPGGQIQVNFFQMIINKITPSPSGENYWLRKF